MFEPMHELYPEHFAKKENTEQRNDLDADVTDLLNDALGG